jgi:hypothetical protein
MVVNMENGLKRPGLEAGRPGRQQIQRARQKLWRPEFGTGARKRRVSGFEKYEAGLYEIAVL